MQSVPITTDVVRSNHDQGEVYNIMSTKLSMTCDRSVVTTLKHDQFINYQVSERNIFSLEP